MALRETKPWAADPRHPRHAGSCSPARGRRQGSWTCGRSRWARSDQPGPGVTDVSWSRGRIPRVPSEPGCRMRAPNRVKPSWVRRSRHHDQREEADEPQRPAGQGDRPQGWRYCEYRSASLTSDPQCRPHADHQHQPTWGPATNRKPDPNPERTTDLQPPPRTIRAPTAHLDPWDSQP